MKAVEVRDNCLLLDQKPVILLSSSLFYFRIPEMYWEERMRQLKAGGYNAIDIYIPWNFHETAPGEWNFSGMRDLEHFLKLAAENNLYVVARPGPYICSEWDGGALPAWLFTMDLQLRQYDPAYLEQVERWFSRIFPILKRYQYGKGGSVILIQLENELDIYQCREPKLYLEALRKMADPYEFEIPLVVCTSSQLDVDYSGANAEGTYPAFNLYSSPDHPALEEKMQVVWEHLQKRGYAFLTTETMREHFFLRRELIGGIRLLSPYCQTASANYDCYTGISTWGNYRGMPISYMTNDYDHGAMLCADGRVTEEYFEGRLLGSLIAALGEKLAAGVPDYQCRIPVTADFEKEAERYISMKLQGGGELLCVPNLGRREGCVSFLVEENVVSAPVGGWTTLFFPIHLPLEKWGAGQAQIVCSSMEILSIEEEADGGIRMVLYGEGSGTLIADGGAKWLILPGSEKNILLQNGRTLLVQAVSREKAARMRTKYLPEFQEQMACRRKQEPLTQVAVEPFLWPEADREGKPACMESYGQYFGTVLYDFEVSEQSRGLLLEGAADMVRVTVDQKTLDASYGTGGMLYVRQPGMKVGIRIESWGHNCGHGIGYPVIRLGGVKGLKAVSQVLEERDIQYNWRYHVMPNHNPGVLRLAARQWSAVCDFGDRLPMDIEEMQVYQKEILMPAQGRQRFLHIEGGEIPVRIFVNGKQEGTISAEDRWLDISDVTQAGQKANIAAVYPGPHLNPEIGHMYLIAADPVETCRTGLYPVSALKQLQAARAACSELPFPIPNGQVMKLSFPADAAEGKQQRWISFAGRGIKATVINRQCVLGRIFVGCDMPLISVCSGDPDRIWLPDAFLEQDDQIIVLAEAMEENAVLEKVILETR